MTHGIADGHRDARGPFVCEPQEVLGESLQFSKYKSNQNQINIMKPLTNSNETNISDELRQARTAALDHTAEAIRSIRRQRELTEEEGVEGIGEIEVAESSVKDAMFYLAVASALDDEDRIREILNSYELGAK